MAKTRISVKKFIQDLNFKLVSGEEKLDTIIESPRVSRPGIELAGFFDFFEKNRVVLFGTKDARFMDTLPLDVKKSRLDRIFSFHPPVVVLSMNLKVTPILLELSKKYQVPLVIGDMGTTGLLSEIQGYLIDNLAERKVVHGVLMDIHGFGTLITGPSGIGKSEIALELLKRGHSLISDDRVDIYQKEVGLIVGEAPEVIRRFIEIRGIGIVDVVQLFGIGAYRENKKIRLVVDLQKWDDVANYDRIGQEKESITFFDTTIPKITIPVSPGRNVAILVESAALNEKLKYFGYNASEVFQNKVIELMEEKKANDLEALEKKGGNHS